MSSASEDERKPSSGTRALRSRSLKKVSSAPRGDRLSNEEATLALEFVKPGVLRHMKAAVNSHRVEALGEKDVFTAYSGLHAVLVHVLPDTTELTTVEDVNARVTWLLRQPLPGFVAWFLQRLQDEGKMHEFFSNFFLPDLAKCWTYDEQDVLTPSWLQPPRRGAATPPSKSTKRASSGDDDEEDCDFVDSDAVVSVPAPCNTLAARRDQALQAPVVKHGFSAVEDSGYAVAASPASTLLDFLGVFQANSVAGTSGFA